MALSITDDFYDEMWDLFIDVKSDGIYPQEATEELFDALVRVRDNGTLDKILEDYKNSKK